VTSSAGGRELPAPAASALAAGAGETEEPRPLPTGEGEVTTLDAGVWNLTIDAPGHIPSTRTIELEPGDERTLAVTLERVRGRKRVERDESLRWAGE
jgi:hypothetical protein